MKREEAFNLLKENIKNQNLIKHSLAVEAAMRDLAEYLESPEVEKQRAKRAPETEGVWSWGRGISEKWGICGLLHDIDYEKTKTDPNLHSKMGAEMLKNLGFEKEICDAVLTHNEAHKIFPETKMAKALYCVDPLTGLIVAATLVLPSKKINELKVENILNRFKEKSFAKGANREIIKKCEEFLGLSLEKFVEIVLKAMQKISGDLGL